MIAILYESDEWSNRYLRDALAENGITVLYIDFELAAEDLVGGKEILSDVSLIVNRLFPSAFCRGHMKTYNNSRKQLSELKTSGIPMINSYAAFEYDFSKKLTGFRLSEMGIATPEIYLSSTNPIREPLPVREKIKYPCIIKPDCGGRTTLTHILKSESDLRAIARKLPDIEFLFQEYIEPASNCIHRIEIFGPGDKSSNMAAFRRSIDREGLSAYSRGATYEKINEIDPVIIEIIRNIMLEMDLKVASFDLIQDKNGKYYVIDINATPNYAPSDIKTFGYNPLGEIATTIIEEYEKVH